MKDFLKRLFSILLICCTLMAAPALLPSAAAAGPVHTVVLKIDSPYCAVGNEVRMVDPENRLVTPVIFGDRTLLPIRMLIEAFGGSVEWEDSTRQVTCTLGDHSAVLTVDSLTALADGQEVTLDVPAIIRNDRTLTPVRFVSERLGLYVGWSPEERLAVVSDSVLPEDPAVLPEAAALLRTLKAYETDPLTLTQSSYVLPSGTVTASVVTADLNNPRVRVEARHVDSRLNHTAAFSSIVTESGADAVINANFFNAYDEYKIPIGTLISNGEYLYSLHGLTSLGLDGENNSFWGMSSHVNMTVGSESFRCYNVNYLDESELYTPVFGDTVAAPRSGQAVTAENGRVTAVASVSAGTEVQIPANGFVLFRGGSFRVGDSVSLTPCILTDDGNSHPVTQLVSGGPRLVKDGVSFTELTTGFDGANFTTLSAPRSAVGTTADNRLILVNVPTATI